MKKLLITTALGLVASFVNAASVAWSSGTFDNGFTDHTGTSLASSTAYTMTVFFYSDSEGKNSVAVTGNSAGTGQPNGRYYAKTSDSFANSTASETMTYYVKAIISGKDGTGADYYREAALASFTTGTSGDVNLNFMTGAGFDTESIKWGDWKAGTGPGPEPIPEPSSALLVLLGMAGLALKRKRA